MTLVAIAAAALLAAAPQQPPPANVPIYGTRSTPNNRPLSAWEPGIRAELGVTTIIDAAATADLQAGIGPRWRAPYVAFGDDSYTLYHVDGGSAGASEAYRLARASGQLRPPCPLDAGAPWAGTVRLPRGARFWDPGRGTAPLRAGTRAAGNDIHVTVVDELRNRVYAFYSPRGQPFGVVDGTFRSASAGCDLLSADGRGGPGDAALRSASERGRRYACRGGHGYPAAACGLAGVGGGVSAGHGFGNGDSNGFMGPHGVIIPQDFDDTRWTGEAVGTLHHALRCSFPATAQHGYVWPMQDPEGGTTGRAFRGGQIMRLDPGVDVVAVTGGAGATAAQLAERRLLRTLQRYGCVNSDYAAQGMELFALSAWPETGPGHPAANPWTPAGGANEEARAFYGSPDARGVRAAVSPWLGTHMDRLQIVLPHGAAHPPRTVTPGRADGRGGP